MDKHIGAQSFKQAMEGPSNALSEILKNQKGGGGGGGSDGGGGGGGDTGGSLANFDPGKALKSMEAAMKKNIYA